MTKTRSINIHPCFLTVLLTVLLSLAFFSFKVSAEDSFFTLNGKQYKITITDTETNGYSDTSYTLSVKNGSGYTVIENSTGGLYYVAQYGGKAALSWGRWEDAGWCYFDGKSLRRVGSFYITKMLGDDPLISGRYIAGYGFTTSPGYTGFQRCPIYSYDILTGNYKVLSTSSTNKPRVYNGKLYFTRRDGTKIYFVRSNASGTNVEVLGSYDCHEDAYNHDFADLYPNRAVVDGKTIYYKTTTSKTKKLLFNACGGSVKKTSLTVTVGKLCGTLPVPVRSGYTFLGWYSSQYGGFKVSKTTMITSPKAMKLYARWKLNPVKTIYFNGNGGTVSTSSKRIRVGMRCGMLPIPVRPKFSFSGWYTSRSGGWRLTSATKTTNSKSMIVYAHWEPKGRAAVSSW